MMMTDDARDDAVAYLDVLCAYDDDDAAVMLTCVQESVIPAKHTRTPTRLTRDNLLHAGTHLHPGSSAPSEGQPRNQACTIVCRNGVSSDEEVRCMRSGCLRRCI
jgi:hypothetical protein